MPCVSFGWGVWRGRGGGKGTINHLARIHQPDIRVRQQPRLAQHELAHGGHVLDGRAVAELRQVLARGRPPRLRSVAQREEGLGAPRSLASGGNLQDFFRSEVGFGAGWEAAMVRECAVAA